MKTKNWSWQDWEEIFSSSNNLTETAELRVPGGFIYRYIERTPDGDVSVGMVFAPFVQQQNGSGGQNGD